MGLVLFSQLDLAKVMLPILPIVHCDVLKRRTPEPILEPSPTRPNGHTVVTHIETPHTSYQEFEPDSTRATCVANYWRVTVGSAYPAATLRVISPDGCVSLSVSQGHVETGVSGQENIDRTRRKHQPLG